MSRARGMTLAMAAALIGLSGLSGGSPQVISIGGGEQVASPQQIKQAQQQGREFRNPAQSMRLGTTRYLRGGLSPTQFKRTLYTYHDGARGIFNASRRQYVHTPKHLRMRA